MEAVAERKEKVVEEEEEEGGGLKRSLFPVLGDVSNTSQNHTPPWLCNTSFNATDLKNDAFSAASPSSQSDQESEEEKEHEDYVLLEEDETNESQTKKKKKKRKRERAGEIGSFLSGSRKPNVRAWAGSHTQPPKDYYFDSRGDPDNLAFGCLYRMDVPRYKRYDPTKLSSFDSHQCGSSSILDRDRDSDADALDTKLKSSGRYWSAKHAALELHNSLKRVRILAPGNMSQLSVLDDDFLPLLDIQTSSTSLVEESWDDQLLRRTREFNILTREHPHDENAWLAFAEFQDRVASMQPTKGARLQTLEKKISILEKAAELNPGNEQLLICLLKAYQNRDSSDLLISKWEKILMQHSGSYKLWREFLRVVQVDFSRFKVSDMRKMYAHAIQALSASCSRQLRQLHQNVKAFPDPTLVQQELGLVDIFLSLCRFESQAGYHELATALFQAEIEFSLFCPSLFLNEQNKQRLFEHFWNSDGARVGEEAALGWCKWLEKEEENRQRVMIEESSHDKDGGSWTGWSEPLSRHKETISNLENVVDTDVAAEEIKEEIENEVIKQEDCTEALLKLAGIDLGAGANCDVKDCSTWSRWSEEESSRDCDQWMPIRSKPDKATDGEADEQFLRVVLHEDVSEYMFSLSSEEARLSLVYQFIDFFGGIISQRFCTNNSSWIEKILSIEALPDSILHKLRRIHDIIIRSHRKSDSFNLELLLGSTGDISRQTEMVKFLRNATLLCLSAFPRNYILEEAALVAEELFVTRMNSCSCSVMPCRALAKSLLKSDRQDVLLCGVYARREAAFGNIDQARRVFDMALSSIEGLTLDIKSNAPLLYLWYAELELASDSGPNPECSSRALHILSCLGSGEAYTPYTCQPSSLQLLKGRQGFKERIRAVRSAWRRGIIDDQSIALIHSAALLEELTTGWAAGIEVLDQAFTMMIPERRFHSYHLECLFHSFVKMLHRHHKESGLTKVWESILQGLQIYPSSPELLSTLVEINHVYTTPNNLRLLFDDYCHKKPSVIVWIFALSYEMSRGGSQHRIHGLFERALANDQLHKSVVLWRLYIAYEITITCNPSAARRIFFRAIHACPWSKKLWLDGFLKLNSVLTSKELSDLQEVMRDKELNLRTDIYEILLQDELVP
ncbi:NRDE-2 domain-containing protein [Cephalotus follicularis]|uniref:NRDE-2 domain-containing protein n=1 Tax=Cephalotus follicularis TaxID=3775 RepID=A0A1Q3BI86_CEPFO|nr:NRDE-2 domain-containing protein [Cephalotus follicularis]